jgi:cobalt/nickel transport system permease protein
MDRFLEKTIQGIYGIFEDFFYSDEIASKNGLMQSLDPRVKLLSILLLIVIANVGKSVFFLSVFAIYTVILAFLSKIPLKAYIKRVAVISVIFTGIILLPSTFNFFEKGNPLIYFGKNIYITKEGALASITLMMRSFVSLSFVYILSLSTKWTDILKAFRAFHLPQVLTTTLEMSLRYIFLLLEISLNTFLAGKSRKVGKIRGKDGRKFVASVIGNILIRSNDLTEEVYKAMVSRGYRGEYKTSSLFKITQLDYIWISFNLIFIIVLFNAKL